MTAWISKPSAWSRSLSFREETDVAEPPRKRTTELPLLPSTPPGRPRSASPVPPVSSQETSILPRLVQDVPLVSPIARTAQLPQQPAEPPPASTQTQPRAELPRVRIAPHKLGEEIDARLIMLTDGDSPRAASFRVLRHRLVERGDPRVLVVSSPRRGDGKTTLAANLALALGECGRARVLLIEANTRAPALAALFRFLPPECFATQLERHRAQRDDPWSVVELSHGGTQLHVAAVRPERPPVALVDSLSLGVAIDVLRHTYDYVVIDTPPVLGVADVNLTADFADGALLAVRARQTSARDLRAAVDQLGKHRVLGVTLLDP
jgi:Mrp family chromosome partitioning ATPase